MYTEINMEPTTDPQAQLEQLRARATRVSGTTEVSGAGIPGGVNAVSPSNVQDPLLTTPGGGSSGGAAGGPTDAAQGQLKQEKGEATGIVSSLKTRLKALTDRGE